MPYLNTAAHVHLIVTRQAWRAKHRDERPLASLEALYHRTNVRRLAAWESVVLAARRLAHRGGLGHAFANVRDFEAERWNTPRLRRKIWRLYRVSYDQDGPGGITWDGEGLREEPTTLLEHEAAQELCRRIEYGTSLNGRWTMLAKELGRRFEKRLREVYPPLTTSKSRPVARDFPMRVHVNGRDYWYREMRDQHVTSFVKIAWCEEEAQTVTVGDE